MAKVIEGLYYSESHEYVKVEGEFAYVGITDYAQNALGNVVYVDLPEVDDEVEADEDFGAVESVKAASDLISPVSGTVVEVNEALEDKPELSRFSSLIQPSSTTLWMHRATRISAKHKEV